MTYPFVPFMILSFFRDEGLTETQVSAWWRRRWTCGGAQHQPVHHAAATMNVRPSRAASIRTSHGLYYVLPPAGRLLVWFAGGLVSLGIHLRRYFLVSTTTPSLAPRCDCMTLLCRLRACVFIAVSCRSESVSFIPMCRGWFADTAGRRPALQLGLLGTIVACIAFGLSPNFWCAMAARVAWGLLNGNVGVAKTALSELVPDAHTAKAFSFIGLNTGFGRLIGPAIGGLLAEPCRKYGWNIPLFVDFPYLLPCLVAAIMTACTMVMAWFTLEETLQLSKAEAAARRKSAANASNSNTSSAGEAEADDGDQGGEHMALIPSASEDTPSPRPSRKAVGCVAPPSSRYHDQPEAPAGQHADAGSDHEGVDVEVGVELTGEQHQDGGGGSTGNAIDHCKGGAASGSPARSSSTSAASASSVSADESGDRSDNDHAGADGDRSDNELAGADGDRGVASSGDHSLVVVVDVSSAATSNRDISDVDRNRKRKPKVKQKRQVPVTCSGQQSARSASSTIAATAAAAPAMIPDHSREPFLVSMHRLLFKDRPVSDAVILYALLGLVGLVSNELLPIYLLNDAAHGGFSWDSTDLGISAMTAGPLLILFQAFAFARLCKWIGLMRVQRWNLALFAFMLATTPLQSLALQLSKWWQWAILLIHFNIITVCRVASFICVFIVVANSALPEDRGKANGLGQAFVSLVRAVGPPIWTSVFAWSVSDDDSVRPSWLRHWPFDFSFAWYCMAVMALVTLAWTYRLPAWVEEKRKR